MISVEQLKPQYVRNLYTSPVSKALQNQFDLNYRVNQLLFRIWRIRMSFYAITEISIFSPLNIMNGFMFE